MGDPSVIEGFEFSEESEPDFFVARTTPTTPAAAAIRIHFSLLDFFLSLVVDDVDGGFSACADVEVLWPW